MTAQDRAIGALLGLAIGDAIGTTGEFKARDSYAELTGPVGGGPFRLEPGQWTDDTSMALCLADTLLCNGGLNEKDLMDRFVQWRDHKGYSCTGRCFDIGMTVSKALSRYQATDDPRAGSTDPYSAGNGSLMRLSPVAIRYWGDAAQAADVARRQSVTTHAAPAAVEACAFYATLLVEAIRGAERASVLAPRDWSAEPSVHAIARGGWRGKDRRDIKSSGYVIHSLEAALWAVGTTESFAEAVLTAANLGDDADTVAAITGQLAGALYGASAIPRDWLDVLAWREEITDRAEALFAAGDPVRPTAARSNRALFDKLMSEGRLTMTRTPLFETAPRAHDRPVDPDRVEGLMLGLAIGDALGNTSESMLPGARARTHGEIRDYLPNRNAGGRPIGLPSDDTQMAAWTLEHLKRRRGLDPAELAAIFTSRRIYGIGSSVRTFIRNYKQGTPWPEASARSAGNGALMRIAPIVIPHLESPSPDLWIDAALCAAITHNDRGSIAACVGFVGLLWDLLDWKVPPSPSWWLDSFERIAGPIEGESAYRPRGGAFEGRYQGSITGFSVDRVREALTGDATPYDWYSGAYLVGKGPSVLYILARYAEDPEEAIVRAVNDTKDNDTIAAIVGAAVGALHGAKALPTRWREGVN